MAAPSYNRNGYQWVPALEVGQAGLVGGPVVDVYANFNIAPAATGALIQDFVVVPGLTVDAAGQYFYIWAIATVVNNVNSKTVTFNIGGTGTVGGAVTGGVTAVTVTGTTVANLAAYAFVMKVGTNSYNVEGETVAGAVAALSRTAAQAVTDTAKFQINLVLNAATAASDITGVDWGVQFCG